MCYIKIYHIRYMLYNYHISYTYMLYKNISYTHIYVIYFILYLCVHDMYIENHGNCLISDKNVQILDKIETYILGECN